MSPSKNSPTIATIVRDENIADLELVGTKIEPPSNNNIMIHSITRWTAMKCWELKASIFPSRKRKGNSAVPVVSTAHLFSDCIIFLCSSIESALSMYLAWINECGEISARQRTRPTARVVIVDHLEPLNTDIFLRLCLMERSAGPRDEKEIRECCFAGLDVVVKPSAELVTLTRGLEEEVCIAWNELEAAVFPGERIREYLGRLWSQDALSILYQFWCDTGNVPDAISLLTAEFAGNKEDTTRPGIQRGPNAGEDHDPVVEVESNLKWYLESLDKCKVLTDHAVSMLAGILARHSLLSDHWAVPGPDYNVSAAHLHFSQEHFQHRYEHVLRSVLAPFQNPSQPGEVAFLTSHDSVTYPLRSLTGTDLVSLTQQHWIKLMRCFGKHESAIDIAREHVKSLRLHRSFVHGKGQKHFCSICVYTPWETLLQCGHGLCRLCLSASFEQEEGSSHFVINGCPTCLAVPTSPYTVNPIPSTAAVRVLSLDGGGVRGIVQLEILHLLEQRIGLNVPFTTFFDLMVGTSIGKRTTRSTHSRKTSCSSANVSVRWNMCPWAGPMWLVHSRMQRKVPHTHSPGVFEYEQTGRILDLGNGRVV